MIESRWTDKEMAFLRGDYPLEPKQQILNDKRLEEIYIEMRVLNKRGLD